MLENGIDSKVLCVTSNIQTKGIYTFGTFRLKYYALLNKLSRIILKKKIRDNFSFPLFGHSISQHVLVKEADIIYLHWTQGGFLSLKNIRELGRLNKPVILSCRDFWYLTGGCHSPIDCTRYQDHCNNCFYLNSNIEKDLSYSLFEKKKNIYNVSSNINVLVPSIWLLEAAKYSHLTMNKPLFCIPNVINQKIFHKYDRLKCREVFSLPLNRKLILFGAIKPTANKNKGWEFLIQSLERLKGNSFDFELVIFGSDIDESLLNLLPYKINFMGKIRDENVLAQIYSSCDVYVTPSLSESFGNTILESLSCETPVVAFNIGGAADMIDHKKNGYLADYKNVADLTKGIIFCLVNQVNGYLKPGMNAMHVLKQHVDMIDSLITKQSK